MTLSIAPVRAALIAFTRDESGTTAIEYGIIAACMFLAVVAGVTTLGGKVGNMMWNTLASKM